MKLKLPIGATKNEIRRLCTDIRDKISNRGELSARLWTHLYSIDEYRLCENVLVYAAIGSEPNTVPLIEKALADGKKVYCPRICNTEMDFFHIENLSELKPSGKYNIPEPPGDIDRVFNPADINNNTITIVPALCVNRRGYRIGYGGGYYDKYFRKYSVYLHKIFPVCAIFSSLYTDYFPNEQHDIPVKMIITENEIINIEKTKIGGQEYEC